MTASKKPAKPKQPAKTAKPDPAADLTDEQLDKVSGGVGSHSSGAGAGKVTFNPF